MRAFMLGLGLLVALPLAGCKEDKEAPSDDPTPAAVNHESAPDESDPDESRPAEKTGEQDEPAVETPPAQVGAVPVYGELSEERVSKLASVVPAGFALKQANARSGESTVQYLSNVAMSNGFSVEITVRLEACGDCPKLAATQEAARGVFKDELRIDELLEKSDGFRFEVARAQAGGLEAWSAHVLGQARKVFESGGYSDKSLSQVTLLVHDSKVRILVSAEPAEPGSDIESVAEMAYLGPKQELLAAATQGLAAWDAKLRKGAETTGPAPAEFVDVSRWAVNTTLVGQVPKGWFATDRERLRAPESLLTWYALDATCDGYCKPKDWATLVKAEFDKRVAGVEKDKLVTQEPLASGDGFLLVERVDNYRGSGVQISLLRYQAGKDGYITCSAFLANERASEVDAFVKACKTAKFVEVPNDGAKIDGAQKPAAQAGCEALIDRRLGAAAPLLTRLKTNPADLGEAIKKHNNHFVSECAKLPETTRACLDKASEPLTAWRSCYLQQPIEPDFDPKQVALLQAQPLADADNATATNALVGTWTHSSERDGEVKLVVAAGGAATLTTQEKGSEPETKQGEITVPKANTLGWRDGSFTRFTTFVQHADTLYWLSSNSDTLGVWSDSGDVVLPSDDGIVVTDAKATTCRVLLDSGIVTVDGWCAWEKQGNADTLLVRFRRANGEVVRERWTRVGDKMLPPVLSSARFSR